MEVIWWITAAVGAIAINLIASELFAWGPRLSEGLMRSAVRRLLPEMQERMHHADFYRIRRHAGIRSVRLLTQSA